MTREEAISEARVTAEWEGWRWFEPVKATRKSPWFSRKRYWDIRTNMGRQGDHVHIVIDDSTGEIREKHLLAH